MGGCQQPVMPEGELLPGMNQHPLIMNIGQPAVRLGADRRQSGSAGKPEELLPYAPADQVL